MSLFISFQQCEAQIELYLEQLFRQPPLTNDSIPSEDYLLSGINSVILTVCTI